MTARWNARSTLVVSVLALAMPLAGAGNPVLTLRGGWVSPLLPELLPSPSTTDIGSKTRQATLARSETATRSIWRLYPAQKTSSEEVCSAEQVEQSIVIEASAEDCFLAATRYEDYPKWAAGMKDVKVLEKRSDGLGVVVEFVMGIFGMTTRNKMKYEYRRPHSMNWHVTEGGIKELVGRYDFVPLGPDRTKVVYKLRVEPGFPFPQMLKKATSRAVASAALNDLKRWTESKAREAASMSTASSASEESDENSEVSTEAVRHLVALC